MKIIPGGRSDRMDEQHKNSESKHEPYSSDSFDLDKQVQDRLRELKSHTLEFRQIFLHLLQYSKGPLQTGIILLGVGAASLLLSYLWSSSILTFIGLGISLWGILIIYISPSKHVRAEMLNSISSSMQKCLDSLVTYMGYTGEVIFFHPKSLTGLGQGYIFIPHYTAKTAGILNSNVEALNALPYSSETSTPSVYLDPKGIFLTAPSQGLVDHFEKELGVNFATVDLGYLQQALPTLLIEELKIVDEISIEDDTGNNTVVVRFGGETCVDMCRFVDRETKLGNHAGCPLCSALALVVSKVSGKPVTIKETKMTGDTMISTTYALVNS